MSLIRYEPWDMLRRFQQELGRLHEYEGGPVEGDRSNMVTSQWRPAVDVKEEDTRYVIHADLPGVDPKDIDITMEDGVLTVKGQRQSETRDEQVGYTRVERVAGSFYRRFNLPDTANSEGISARGENGVLEVVIPKQEKAQPKKIAVKS